MVDYQRNLEHVFARSDELLHYEVPLTYVSQNFRHE